MDRNNERLSEILLPIAAGSGLELMCASFFRPKEFQAVWRISGKGIEIRIPDYLMDAPDDALEDFLGTLVRTAITERRVSHGDAFLDWVRSDKYVSSKRKIYLGRSRNLTGTSEGNERDLTDSLDRLLDSDLLKPESIDNSFFSWTRTCNIRKMGFCSPMMRVVGISSYLDDVSVPEFVLDYVVYHEALHLAQGYRPGQRAHTRSFREEERKFPMYEEAERFLRSLKTGRK